MKVKTFTNPALLLICLMFFSCSTVRSQQIARASNNTIEAYRVAWWNQPVSFGLSGKWSRPMYWVIDINNGELALRHAILEGRPLVDYRLP